MKWFKGSVAEAIQASKSSKSVFIVYVYGEDEMSAKMENVLEENTVTETCANGRCVAVKLSINSPDGKFFSQIYPILIVPSIYLIGENGAPLEVLAGSKEVEELNTTMQNVIKLHEQNLQKTTVNPLQNDPELTDIQPDMQEASHHLVSETTIIPESPEVSMEQSDTASASVEPNIIGKTPPLNEEKLDRVKVLMEQKRGDKLVKEKEEEKRKEQERRDLGKGLSNLKQMQNEMKAKEVMDQIKKDKDEEKRAREKIKEEIERDRRERSARFKREKEDRDRESENAKKAKLEAAQQQLTSEAAIRSEIARIQFRLADGSCILQQFPSDETFQIIYNFITERIGKPVRLSTSFPKRIFTTEDFSQSLISLQLAPSASIIVLPAIENSVLPRNTSSTGGLYGLLNTLFISPLLVVWNFMCQFFMGTNKPSEDITNQPQTKSQPSTSSGFQHRPDRPATAFRRRTPNSDFTDEGGNVRKFRNTQDDDDDENATWNGNSTQQM